MCRCCARGRAVRGRRGWPRARAGPPVRAPGRGVGGGPGGGGGGGARGTGRRGGGPAGRGGPAAGEVPAGFRAAAGPRIGGGSFYSRYAGAMLLHAFAGRVGAAGVLSAAAGGKPDGGGRRLADVALLSAASICF